MDMLIFTMPFSANAEICRIQWNRNVEPGFSVLRFQPTGGQSTSLPFGTL